MLLAGLTPEWHGYLPSPFTDGYEESTSYGREAVASIVHRCERASTSLIEVDALRRWRLDAVPAHTVFDAVRSPYG